mmetsp:Transcript_10453/g.63879  ORF Transcript_10453/g.63879 Transcript_10453/m.63879 type:complete len:236 (+) Transcript_10453:326-1033(+)
MEPHVAYERDENETMDVDRADPPEIFYTIGCDDSERTRRKRAVESLRRATQRIECETDERHRTIQRTAPALFKQNARRFVLEHSQAAHRGPVVGCSSSTVGDTVATCTVGTAPVDCGTGTICEAKPPLQPTKNDARMYASIRPIVQGWMDPAQPRDPAMAPPSFGTIMEETWPHTRDTPIDWHALHSILMAITWPRPASIGPGACGMWRPRWNCSCKDTPAPCTPWPSNAMDPGA